MSQTFHSINPATGETTASHPEMGEEEVQTRVTHAAVAQKEWSKKSPAGRAGPILTLRRILLEKKQELAAIITREMGKPIAQARSEIEKCAWGCEYYAEHGAEFLQPELIEIGVTKSMVVFKPLGVILAIMPWNYPFWQVFRFAVPALLAGNGVVLKHAPNVFGCARALEELFALADFPKGIFQSLIIDIPMTTKLIHDPRIAALTLTGSVKAGRAVAAEAGKALKKCVLELGGSDPFIILADADLDKAVEAGLTSRFLNTGQSCIAAKRFIVVETRREEFENQLLEQVRHMKVGAPTEAGVFIGPMARRDLRDYLHEQVEASVKKGARLLLGGKKPKGPDAFYPPTVLSDVHAGMPAYSEELFGPVAAIIPVKDEAEAIAVANDTDFGLGASLWTQDLAKGERIATEGIAAGSCFVNGMTRSDPRLPFGGIKNSGYGRELSGFGIREFTNVQTVVVQ
jgi:succinate-semialdehyde dehydrogenase/glutarate-semialdehyde dehydrogenase